jgi:endonuclease-3
MTPAPWKKPSGREDASRPPKVLATRAAKIVVLLKKMYPASRCSLDFRNPYELLVATILSAQCTDERVNRVTKGLFRKHPTPQALAKTDLAELEQKVRPCGFYKNKAKSLQACARSIVDVFRGKVPDELDELVKLAGVGRKTANVVLGNAYGKPAVVVETHVLRIAARLGLTREKDPVKIELEFMRLFPEKDWSHLAHLFIDHGRAVCKAPRPRCEMCRLQHLCDYFRSSGPRV